MVNSKLVSAFSPEGANINRTDGSMFWARCNYCCASLPFQYSGHRQTQMDTVIVTDLTYSAIYLKLGYGVIVTVDI